MKVENPILLIVMVVLVAGGIIFLMSGKTTIPGAGDAASNSSMKDDADPFSPYPSASELSGIAGYINAPQGFMLADAKGKVVIIDFWTYSCINCIRTQPYLNAWYEKYREQGLEIIGVHAPEFEFEKKLENVQAAVEKAGVKYPVVLDNDMFTWRAYQNHYWPHKYLVDADGYIRYDHIGEGGYAETEEQIQKLLKERDDTLALTEMVSGDVLVETPPADFSKIQTPEIYLGYQFARAPLGNAEGFVPEETAEYAFPDFLEPNRAALEGTWLSKRDYMELVSDNGAVALTYTAKNVNIVASGDAEVLVEIDQEINETLQTSEEKLYSAVEGTDYGTHTLVLNVNGKGFRLYTFTFG